MTSQFQPSPHVVAEPTEEGLCLLHTTRGECHLLNQVGAFVWNALETHAQENDRVGIDPNALAQQVSAAYGVEPETAQADIKAFIIEAEKAGLVVTNAKEEV